MRLSTAAALVFSACVLLTSAPMRAQQPAQTPRFRAATAAVIVDVVVRDASGRLVTDLAKDEFRITENGDPQTITSFRLVGPATTEENTSAPGILERARRPAGAAEPHAIALVFDRLSFEARLLAQRATLAYLHDTKRPGDRVGVFAIDLSLTPLQTFTDDERAVEAAVTRATRRPSTRIGVPRVDPSQGGLLDMGRGGAATSAPAPSTTIPSADVFEEMLSRADKTYENLERDHAGYVTLNALLAIVHAMRQLPGRKTLVFFSEGLILPEGAHHHFESLMDTANRANVAIYTLDAAGLRVQSPLQETREYLELYRGLGDGVARALMHNREAGLTILATETGGAATRDTNDLLPALRRIGEEVGAHYLLGYTPSNQNFDGTFRRIGVSVTRPHIEVRARRGYTAVREDPTVPVLRFEAPAVALLDSGLAPNAFPIRAGALLFPESKRPGLSAVLVQVPIDSITFRENADKKGYETDFSVVVRLKNQNEQIVRKLSQQFELGGAVNQLEAAKRGEVQFYREVVLTPGVFTLEAVVYDAISQKASTRFSTIEVTPIDPNVPRLSTLMIVRRIGRVSVKDHDDANPLQFGDVVVYPNLGEPLRKGTDNEVSFAAAIYPPVSAAVPPTATIELLHNGQRIGQSGVQLPAPDASGRIQYIGRLPVDSLTAGSYELRLTVSGTAGRQIRSALFRIE